MWSEHCSYKSSRIHLKKLPTRGPRVAAGARRERRRGRHRRRLAAVFKIESHNHPSFIEPYQGAATGVGGIIRDIFTMGARPIALLNSLRFGPLDGPDGARTRRIVEGVVAGIAGYGNSIGIPTIGGEIAFDDRLRRQPAGERAVPRHRPMPTRSSRARPSGAGNPVYYVGAKTGRDGIHGATMASAEFDEKSAEKRPAVQVGDPFMEKLLLEACLELMKTDALIGVQDMGAAGLTCSTCEMGSRGGAGVEIDVSTVPQRETGMTPYEIMLSESQERMLLVVKKGREAEVEAIFDKWDLHAAHIGEVTERRADAGEGSRQGRRRDSEHARWSTRRRSTTGRPSGPPISTRCGGSTSRALARRMPPATAFLRAPGVADDRQQALGLPAVRPHGPRRTRSCSPGMGAGVVRVKGTSRALAISTDGNGRYCYLDPRRGAMLAVAEAARNVACAGAVPIGATNCLNFGNPQRPEIMWQLVEAIEGIAEACRALDIPITGGNVSLYNETDGKAIYPTPIIGVVGLIEDASRDAGADVPGRGDAIVLLGESFGELGGSEYLKTVHGLVRGAPPALDLERERALIKLLDDGGGRRPAAVGARLFRRRPGGDAGANAAFDTGGHRRSTSTCPRLPWPTASASAMAATLFGESASRVVVSVSTRSSERRSWRLRQQPACRRADIGTDRRVAHPDGRCRGAQRSTVRWTRRKPSGQRRWPDISLDGSDERRQNRASATASTAARHRATHARQVQGRVRRLRHLRPSRGREPDLPRSLRAAASRPGERRDRRRRRRADARLARDGAGRRSVQRGDAREAAGPPRHRPHPLLDRRREQAGRTRSRS